MDYRQGFIIDLDGTLYRGSERLPYAREFVEAIRASGAPLLLMTNNTTRTPEDVVHHLNELGIPAMPQEVFTAAQAAARYLDERGGGRRVYCIGEHGLSAALTENGFALVEQDADYVVQGLDRSFDYGTLSRALALIGGGAEFVLTNPDKRLPVEGRFMPGAGSIGAAIAAAAGVDPVIVGKPSTVIMNYALDLIGLPPSSVWMVGDNVHTDMAAGKAAGCRTALVLTGYSTRADGEAAQADWIGSGLKELAEHVGLA